MGNMKIDLEGLFQNEVVGNLKGEPSVRELEMMRFAFFHGAYSVALPLIHQGAGRRLGTIQNEVEDLCDDCLDELLGVGDAVVIAPYADIRDLREAKKAAEAKGLQDWVN